jgi:hypothetical protein
VHGTCWEDLRELEWWNVTAAKHAITGPEEVGSQAMNICAVLVDTGDKR